MSDDTFKRPFPALTPEQRYHLDYHGYVVVENTLTGDECRRILDAMYSLRDELRTASANAAENERAEVRGSYLLTDQPHHVFMANIIEADPAITAYATHPRLVGMAEELIGGEARLVEFNAHINSRPADADLSKPAEYGFHRGADLEFFTHRRNGLFHCSFVKTLTNLVDLDPDDGGTVVVAGSHKIDAPTEQLVKLAYEDRSLIHQVVAPAGSTLLFPETLIHATGRIESDIERAIIIGGYGSRLFPWWDGKGMSESFRSRVPDNLKTLFLGKEHWTYGPRYRTLDQPRDASPFALGEWDQRE